MSTYGLAVDPGLRGCGVAIFNLETKELERAAYVKNPVPGDDFTAAIGMAIQVEIFAADTVGSLQVVWGECPRVYPAGGQKGDQNDLIHLAGFIYAIAARFRHSKTTRLYPREWKGTIDADQMLDRIIDRMSSGENARVRNAGALTHNVIDAVGIGLHAVGRLKPKRVFGGING